MVLTNLGRTLGLFILCFLMIGFIHASSIMYMIAFFALALLIGATLFVWRSIRGLSCHRQLPATTIFSGDPLDTTIQLTEARGRWRMLEIFDQHTNLITDQVTRRHMTLMTEGRRVKTAMVAGTRTPVIPGAGETRRLDVPDTIRFARRGHYRLGPLTIYAHDPFGLVYVTRTIPGERDIIVYPHPLPIPSMLVNGAGRRPRHEVRPMGRAGESADFHGIRPYVQGDELRRVHWKATAHTGRLAVKEFEYHTSGAVQVILDLQRDIHFGTGEYATLETGITLAASMLNHVIGSGNQAGLLTTGAKVVNLPPESGQRQLLRTLEALALAKHDGDVPLAQALGSSETQLTRRCTTIVITASTDMEIIGPLLALRGRSTQVLLVLLNPRSFYEAEQEALRPRNPLLALATTPIALKKSAPVPPAEEEHFALLHGATAAGLNAFSIGAGIPLHQALQGIRMRM